MNDFKLLSGDVLVNINDRHDLRSSLKRWLAGPYEHVFVYLGDMTFVVRGPIIAVPMIFESIGKGCCLRSLSERYGDRVVVMRLKSEHDCRRIPFVIREAVMLASDPQSYYDYLCVIRFVLPRLICEKLRLPVPLAWHRDRRQICSEAAFEVFYRAKLVDILNPSYVPLPGDFLDSPLLENMGTVILSPEFID